MNRKMAIAGIFAAVLLVSALGVTVMARPDTLAPAQEQVAADDVMADYELTTGTTDDGGRYLLTREQIQEMRQTAQEMRDNHSTRTEIRETIQAMARGYVQANLESYGLAPEEIAEIQAKISELMDIWLEIRETAVDLWEQDMNRQDIRAELQPLIDQAHEIRAELKDLLDQYGILPPEIGHPGIGHRHGHRWRMGWRRPRP